jgi:hypothetical protein
VLPVRVPASVASPASRSGGRAISSPSAPPGADPSAGLARKLGIGPGDVVALFGAPTGWSAGVLPDGARLRRGLRGPADTVIAFLRRSADLEKALARVVPILGPEDALWLAWPRKAAGHVSDLGDNLVRAAALETGLVDVKVAAIGEDWSGLRFVWRRQVRPSVAVRRREELRGR